MLANTDKETARRSLAAKGSITASVQFEIYEPATKKRGRGYRRIKGSRVIKNFASVEELQQATQAVRELVEAL